MPSTSLGDERRNPRARKLSNRRTSTEAHRCSHKVAGIRHLPPMVTHGPSCGLWGTGNNSAIVEPSIDGQTALFTPAVQSVPATEAREIAFRGN